MDSDLSRPDAIMKAAGVPAIAHAGNGRYALGPIRPPGIRFVASSADGLDEFAIEFQNSEGRAAAPAYYDALSSHGYSRRGNRKDIITFRVSFPPRGNGSVDEEFVKARRQELESILNG